MKIDPESVTIEPGHATRHWQSCNYSAPGADGRPVHLFHERAFMRSLPRVKPSPAALAWLAGGGLSCVQWLPCRLTRTEADELAARWPGSTVEEEFYPDESAPEPLFFLAFHDTDRALAFCASDDFDRHCLTAGKVAA